MTRDDLSIEKQDDVNPAWDRQQEQALEDRFRWYDYDDAGRSDPSFVCPWCLVPSTDEEALRWHIGQFHASKRETDEVVRQQTDDEADR